ncbi:MAG: M1 family metallopeptidase [candidate division KSB1 bacterium]|nr:M1 family metallopeptidase [candidate division KSB1 bacterium]
MKRLTLLLILLVLPVWAFAGNESCDKVVDYTIQASLNPSERTIRGDQLLTWKNPTENAVSTLQFHLYLNAFMNTQSTFMQEVIRSKKFASFLKYANQDSWGYCKINSISANGADLMPINYIHPDDDNKKDRTVFEVNLPAPVRAGETIDIELSFTARLPHNMPRSGYIDNLFFAGQWYPKLGVLEDNGWNCHQFHLTSEFYSNFGDYHVELTVPSKYKIGATGAITDTIKTGNDSVTYKIEQTCVHDFAWTAWPDYRIEERQLQSEDLPPVNIKLLYQPAHGKFVDDYFDAAVSALKHFGHWYIPYPYSQLTIVDVPEKSWFGGMEYPTLITASTPLINPSPSRKLHRTVTHECCHQFFYGLLASNEVEHPWMDEGFSVYATTRCLQATFGDAYYTKTYLDRYGFGIPLVFQNIPVDYRATLQNSQRQFGMSGKMSNKAWEHYSYDVYRNNAYKKPALMLWTLENILEEDWPNIMKSYTQSFSFQHPEPKDFQNLLAQKQPNMSSLVQTLLETPAQCDYAISDLYTSLLPDDQGIFQDGDSLVSRKISRDQDLFLNKIFLQRNGNIKLPVDIALTFENGETKYQSWDGSGYTRRIQFTSESRLIKAEIDPDHKIWLDVYRHNNLKYAESSHLPGLKWTSKWLFWVQSLLEMMTFYS